MSSNREVSTGREKRPLREALMVGMMAVAGVALLAPIVTRSMKILGGLETSKHLSN